MQATVDRMAVMQEQYVTKEILQLRLEAISSDQKEDRARLDNMSRIVWSAVIAPVIVGVILYFLTGGSK